jgi:hypothetical protein
MFRFRPRWRIRASVCCLGFVVVSACGTTGAGDASSSGTGSESDATGTDEGDDDSLPNECGNHSDCPGDEVCFMSIDEGAVCVACGECCDKKPCDDLYVCEFGNLHEVSGTCQPDTDLYGPCTPDGLCSDDMLCYVKPEGDSCGNPCGSHDQCADSEAEAGGWCNSTGDVCTLVCETENVNWDCPAGMVCAGSSGSRFCVWP